MFCFVSQTPSLDLATLYRIGRPGIALAPPFLGPKAQEGKGNNNRLSEYDRTAHTTLELGSRTRKLQMEAARCSIQTEIPLCGGRGSQFHRLSTRSCFQKRAKLQMTQKMSSFVFTFLLYDNCSLKSIIWRVLGWLGWLSVRLWLGS